MFFLPESPRYLFEKGKFQEAEMVLKRIQNFNNKFSKLPHNDFEITLNGYEKEEKQKATIKDLCSKPIYRKNIILMTIIWSFGAFGFFMVPNYLTLMKGNVYVL